MSEYSYPPNSGNSDANGIIRNSDGAYVPNDPGNADWQIYQEWLTAGDVPDSTLVVSATALGNAAVIAQYQEEAARAATLQALEDRLSAIEAHLGLRS